MDVTNYLEVISLIERLHREFLELVKLELERLRLRDISNVQALMLFNIGSSEMTIGELTERGCSLVSNVSYNVQRMVENGYVKAERSVHDLRSIRVKLTNKGHLLRDRLVGMYGRQTEMLTDTNITEADLQGTLALLERLERFWIMASDRFGRRAQDSFAENAIEPSGSASVHRGGRS